MPAPPRLSFLGLDFDPLDAPAAAQTMADRARRAERFAYVATPNVDHVVRLDREPGLLPLYADAWLNLCDSRILEIFARASTLALPCAPGADIVEILFRKHIRADDRVLVIGGSAELAEKLRSDFGLRDLRRFDAPHGLRANADARRQCVDFIRDNPAAFVFLAVGSPQQEMIAREAREAGCTGVAICCGAALEFLSGHTQRAPKWMRAARLEWLYRLGSEPGRLWRRYIVDGPRIFGIWRRWKADQHRASANTPGMAVSSR
jgi:N-acetylglucosaminyldiphosphoundecaprenol N-acetyl-beta-D-mannosaminyltransferase